ncbi:MAG: Competence protein ComM, partial [Planctomycetota bacterium]
MLRGIDALPCEVEVHLSPHGLPQICVVGLPDAAIRESVERVRRAIEVSGFEVPRHHVLVNLAPAGTRKEGPVYDLPIAMGLLFAAGTAEPKRADAPSPADWLIAGELALDGRLRPIRGSVSAALMARDHNRGVIVPIENAIEASLVPGVKVIGASTLCEVVAFFRGEGAPSAPALLADKSFDANLPDEHELPAPGLAPVNFRDIKGQVLAKRAMLIAAAGGHNALLLGCLVLLDVARPCWRAHSLGSCRLSWRRKRWKSCESVRALGCANFERLRAAHSTLHDLCVRRIMVQAPLRLWVEVRWGGLEKSRLLITASCFSMNCLSFAEMCWKLCENRSKAVKWRSHARVDRCAGQQ